MNGNIIVKEYCVACGGVVDFIQGHKYCIGCEKEFDSLSEADYWDSDESDNFL